MTSEMKRILMMRGAKILVENCANVKKGEKVLVITDTEMTSIAETVAGAAYARGAEVVITIMEPRKINGEEPPQVVAEAMKASDVIFAPVIRSITHTHASKNALKAGSRAVFMSSYTEDMMISGGIDADFNSQKPIVEEVARRLSKSEVAEVTTEKGMKLRMVTKGRQVNALTGIVHEPGSFSPVPTIEANVTPLEGSAEGVIVSDASITGIGLLSEPVRISVEKGNVVDISGGREAQRFREMIEGLKDPNAYNIAELGFGLNPKARLIGVMLEDEGVLGTIHIGIGTNTMLGGKIKSPFHSDCIVWNPTVTLDGRPLMQKGKLVL